MVDDATRGGTTGDDTDRPATVIHYTVNGERQQTRRNRLTVEEILQGAGAAAGLDVDDIESYYLQSLADDREYDNLGDVVELRDGDQFLAIYSGSTPVA